MIRCWLCREDVTQAIARMPPGHIGIQCPSCLISLNPEGGQYYNEKIIQLNVGIALARAMDRLTKQLLDDADERALIRQGRNPHKP